MRIYGAEKNIKHCTGCQTCWIKTPGQCVIEDDMAVLLDKMLQVDLVVYGTPIYFRFATGLMKDYLDRTIPLGIPHRPSRYWTEVKKILVSPCALPDFEQFTLLVDLFKKTCETYTDTYMGEILRPAAELMRFDGFKPQYKQYSNYLEKAGEEIINNGNISEGTRLELNKFWISPQEHFKMFAEKMKNIPLE